MADDLDFGAGFVASDLSARRAVSAEADRDAFDGGHHADAAYDEPPPGPDVADRSAVWSADAPLFQADGPAGPASDLLAGPADSGGGRLGDQQDHRIDERAVDWGPDLADRDAAFSADQPLFQAYDPSPASDLVSGPAPEGGIGRFGDGQVHRIEDAPEPDWGPELADRSAVWSADAPLFQADDPTAPASDLTAGNPDELGLNSEMQTYLSDLNDAAARGVPAPDRSGGDSGEGGGWGDADAVEAPADDDLDWYAG